MKRPIRQSMLCALLAAMLLAPCAAPAQSAPKIGYVDMKRLLDEAPQVQQARQRLQQEFAARDAQLNAEQQRLALLRATFAEDQASLSTAEFADRKREIEVLAGSVRRARERLQDDLKQRSSQELDRSWQTISNAAVEYARSNGFDLLLPSPVIYASPNVDVTDAVLERLRRNAGTAESLP